MSTTVNIIIKGIALCYKKDGLWKVLFPFDDCHTTKLSYESGTEKGFIGNLGRANCKVEITTSEAKPAPPSSSDKFQIQILDLTAESVNSGKTFPYDTHPAVETKDGWEKRGVLLTMQSTAFDVHDSLKDYPEALQGFNIFLTDGTTDTPVDLSNPNIDIAHAVKGRIKLDGDNTVTVKADNTVLFTTTPGGNYTLTFDNDCEKGLKPHIKNDMEMHYELIRQPRDENRKFILEGRRSGAPGHKTGTPDFAAGKPCLVVEVSKSDKLP